MFAWIYKIMGKPVPYYAKYSIGLIIWKPIRKYLNVVIVPSIPFTTLRVLSYKALGYKIGKNVFIGMKCYLDDMEPGLTTIGDNVTISYGVKFSIHGKGQGKTPITIEDGAYVGMGAMIISGKKGITIHKNAIVGAGSVVVKTVLPKTIVAGVPAKIIKQSET